MDRSREPKRASMAIANGSARRRQRSSSLRDSPEEDGALELQETARLRDRVSGRKDRDRERDRDHRERERDRDRDRDRAGRSKRRRRERLMQGSHREDGGEESSEESVNDDEDEEDDDGGGSGPLRMFPPNPLSSLSSMPNHPHRKSFTPAGKHFCSPATCKTADEMIGVSVPRKARTASTKRSHDYLMLSANGSAGVIGVGGEQFHRHASASPVRTGLIAAVSSQAPSSPPSSFNPSARKKTKPNGPKQRAPKTASKPPSSNPDEIEFEIAEVLFGLRQNQGPPKLEGDESPKLDSREMNKSCGDVKSRVSSPISNVHSSQPLISLQASSLPASPFSATAPKRKKPRPVRCEEEHSGGLSTRDSPISCAIKAEIDPLPKAGITTNSDMDSGSALENCVHGTTLSQSTPSEPPRELAKHELGKLSETKPPIEVAETKNSTMATEEPPCPRNESPALKSDDCLDAVTTAQTATENHQEEKFQIDLMAPPPQLRSSPERESGFNFGSADSKAPVPIIKTEDGEGNENGDKLGEADERKAMKIVVEEADPPKPAAIKDRNFDLQLDMVMHEVDNTPLHHVPKQSKPSSDLPSADKNAQSSGSSSLQLSVPSWPGAVSPMGLMRPLQGVVSMDASANTVPSMPIQLPRQFFSQPRPKRCATHCYIAQNICHHQRYVRMNPFWPSASSAPSLYGKPCNNNVMMTTEMQASVPVKNPSLLHDSKAPSLTTFISQGGKDKVSQASNAVDKVSRQQILLPPNFSAAAPNSILHAPAFIVPLHQQQAASARPGAGKSPTLPGSAASVVNSTSATTMSFSFPSMPANEAAPYVAILQNGGYQFPIPAPVAAPPPSFFNNPFYSAPMLHPSLLSQQQHQQQPPSAQPQQQHHHNKTISSGSSTSQKNLQSQQQQRAHSSGISSGSGSFPAPKNRQLQPVQQQQHSHHITSLHQARQHEREIGGEGSPSTADSQVSRGSINVYGQSFAMPNLPSAMPSGLSIDEKVQQKHAHQQQGLKASAEPLASQAMAMTLASISGAGTAGSCFDISSMAQNHAILPGLMEPVRHNFQIMAATAQPKREGKTGVGNDERKAMAEKCSVLGQAASSVTAIQGNNVNTGSVSSWATCAIMPAAISTVTASNSQLQQRHQHQQLQQMLQIQKQQQQQPYAAVRSKTPVASNGTVYPEHSTSSMAVKFSNVLSPFPPNSSSPSQSPQWKSAPRVNTSQVGYPALMPSSTSSLKNVRGHQQISFAANTKSSTQQAPGSSQSPPLMVGSPTTSSISKSGGGSPMMATASSSMGSKPGQATSALSSQGKNSHKQSSSGGGGGRNASSIHAHIPASSSTGAKILHQQQAIPQQVSKQALQQGQLFFSQVQVPHYLNAAPTPAAANRYHQAQRRRPEQQQQLQGSSMPSTVASFCPVMRAASNTSDAAKAAASGGDGGGGNVKGVVPPGFHYIQSVPPAVPLNQAEHKQPAGE